MSIATISYAGRENSRRGRINIAERGRKLSGCGGREEDGTSTRETTRRRKRGKTFRLSSHVKRNHLQNSVVLLQRIEEEKIKKETQPTLLPCTEPKTVSSFPMLIYILIFPRWLAKIAAVRFRRTCCLHSWRWQRKKFNF